MIVAHPWLTAVVLARGVREIAWHHQGDFIPEPARALAYFSEANGVERRLNEQAAKALPKPASGAPHRDPHRDPQHWFRDATAEEVWAVFAPDYLRGKARQRKRNALIDAYRKRYGIPRWCGVPEACWKGQDEPTEAEIEAVRREVETKDWWRKRVLPPEVRDLPRGAA